MVNLEDYPEVTTADFIALVRRLECDQPEKPRLGTSSRIKDDPVRLSGNPSLSFQGAAIDKLRQGTKSHPAQLYCNCMGLLGSNGPMPIHFTEHALQRAAHKDDPTFRDFVDIFNHRMLSLFYRAMAETDPAINLDREQENRFVDFTSAVGGFLSAPASSAKSLAKNTRLHFSGWYGAKTRCPDGLVSIISGYFFLPCKIREFIGGWLPIPGQSVIALSSRESGCELGLSCYLGRRTWSSNHKIEIKIGPVKWQQYNTFAPGESNNADLQELVSSYLGDEFDWDIKLELLPGETRSIKLNGQHRLGFNSWLMAPGSKKSKPVSATLSRQQLRVQNIRSRRRADVM